VLIHTGSPGFRCTPSLRRSAGTGAPKAHQASHPDPDVTSHAGAASGQGGHHGGCASRLARRTQCATRTRGPRVLRRPRRAGTTGAPGAPGAEPPGDTPDPGPAQLDHRSSKPRVGVWPPEAKRRAQGRDTPTPENTTRAQRAVFWRVSGVARPEASNQPRLVSNSRTTASDEEHDTPCPRPSADRRPSIAGRLPSVAREAQQALPGGHPPGGRHKRAERAQGRLWGRADGVAWHATLAP
jgi:hypothetical protein